MLKREKIFKKAKQAFDDSHAKKQKVGDRRLLDLLRYRALFGKKRSDDDITDLAIEQWEQEGKDCEKWKIQK